MTPNGASAANLGAPGEPLVLASVDVAGAQASPYSCSIDERPGAPGGFIFDADRPLADAVLATAPYRPGWS
jgi:hypothetical protein